MSYQHELLDEEDVESNKEDLLSYADMRDVMLNILKSSRGQRRIHIQQVLDVLDLTAEIQLHSDNQRKIESEIYSILS